MHVRHNLLQRCGLLVRGLEATDDCAASLGVLGLQSARVLLRALQHLETRLEIGHLSIRKPAHTVVTSARLHGVQQGLRVPCVPTSSVR